MYGYGVDYASLSNRAAALLIDTLLLNGLLLLLQSLLLMFHFDLLASPWMLPSAPVFVWLYFAGCESSSEQATFGKKIFGLRVISFGGERLGFLQATARLLSSLLTVATLGVGYFSALMSQHRQTLHDTITATVVISDR